MTNPYFHVDVFATGPMTGNGLTVFLNTSNWSASAMQRLTREMRQFESIFLSEVSPSGAAARVFTVDEELPFAGHPVLGAAAVLHRTQAPHSDACTWTLRLPYGPVPVSTRKQNDHYLCEMNQGIPILGCSIGSTELLLPILKRLGLGQTDTVSGIQAQVISTGLPYLIVPVLPSALSRARINGTDLELLLGAVGAKFVLILDVEGREARTWDNLGQVEDVATGSAAGPAAAYLLQYGLAGAHSSIGISQGRFAGRPSKIVVIQDKEGNLLVSGEVWPVSHGVLDMDPAEAGDKWAI
jgi:trans-2,3-dihydro-3-hydroxyanthranilate isomerase